MINVVWKHSSVVKGNYVLNAMCYLLFSRIEQFVTIFYNVDSLEP